MSPFRRSRFLRALKRSVKADSIAGLLIATIALVVSGISMYQSVCANRAAAIANKLAAKNVKISEEALFFTKQLEESRGELSLKAEVSSTFPQTLTFTPLSGEFAIASSTIGYLADGGFYYGSATGTLKPGLHDLKQIERAIDGELSAKVKKAEALGKKEEKEGWGTFPFLLTVEYVFHGQSQVSSFLYVIDVRYLPGFGELLWSDEQRAAAQKGYIPLGDVHLVGQLDEANEVGDPPPKALSDLYERWRKQIGAGEIDGK